MFIYYLSSAATLGLEKQRLLRYHLVLYIFDRCDVKSTYFVCFCFQAVSLFWIEAPSGRKRHWYVINSVVYIIVLVGIKTIFSGLYANYNILFGYLLINNNESFNIINVFYCLMLFNLRLLLFKLLQN